MIAVDAVHWPGPLGWLYREVPGNLAASGICFLAAGLKVRSEWLKHRAHERWMAETQAAQHLLLTGHPAKPHPHFDTAAGPSLARSTKGAS